MPWPVSSKAIVSCRNLLGGRLMRSDISYSKDDVSKWTFSKRFSLTDILGRLALFCRAELC